MAGPLARSLVPELRLGIWVRFPRISAVASSGIPTQGDQVAPYENATVVAVLVLPMGRLLLSFVRS